MVPQPELGHRQQQDPGVVHRSWSTKLGAEVQRDKQQTLFGAQGEKQCAGVEASDEAEETPVHPGREAQRMLHSLGLILYVFKSFWAK